MKRVNSYYSYGNKQLLKRVLIMILVVAITTIQVQSHNELLTEKSQIRQLNQLQNSDPSLQPNQESSLNELNPVSPQFLYQQILPELTQPIVITDINENTENIQVQEVQLAQPPVQVVQQTIQQKDTRCLNKWRDQIAPLKGPLYSFMISYQSVFKKSNVQIIGNDTQKNITQQQLTQSINLLYLIHNINSSKQIQVNQSLTCQDKQTLQKMLEQAQKKQYQRLDALYKIEQYHSSQLPFCIVVNAFNTSLWKLHERNIDSIIQQNYTNYRVIYVDDNSPDKTGEKVEEYIHQKMGQSTQALEESRFTLITNPTRIGQVQNTYNAINNHCKNGQIVIMLSGQDSFIGSNVLSLLNAIYQQQKIAITWSKYLLVRDNQRVQTGDSKIIGEQTRQGHIKISRRGSSYNFFQLETFYVDLFKKIQVSDLQYENKQFYDGRADGAIMYPMMEMALNSINNSKLTQLQEILVELRTQNSRPGTFINRQAYQIATKRIQKAKPYQPLDNFSFIDTAIANALKVDKM